MANYTNNDETLSLQAAAPIAQWTAVKLGASVGDQLTCAPAGIADTPLGIAMQDALTGQMVSVAYACEAKAVAAGQIAAGNRLGVGNAAGGLVLASGANTHVVGIALQDAAAGDIFRVLVKIYPYELYELTVDDSTLTDAGGTLAVKALGVTPAQLSAAATSKTAIHERVSGDLTASVDATLSHIARTAGTIADAGLRLGNTGADAANPLSLELDVLINGTSIFTTKPAITKAAADAASTWAAATGVTPGVIDATKNILAAGDLVTYSLTLTRTASPTDEMADAFVQYEIARKVGA